MKFGMFVVAIAGAALVACGPPPAQVAGNYSGQGNLSITGSTGENGSVGLNIAQSGGDLSFNLSMCPVKASSDGAASFKVPDFKCTKVLGSSSWAMTGSGKITTNTNSISITISGKATAGSITTDFTWSYSGSRSP